MKLGTLRMHLAIYTDDWDVTFGGHLIFSQVKQRGDNLIDIEFTDNILKHPDGRIELHQIDFDRNGTD